MFNKKNEKIKEEEVLRKISSIQNTQAKDLGTPGAVSGHCRLF